MNDEINSGDRLLSQKNNNDFFTTLCVVCVILLIYNVFFFFIAFVPIIGDSMENTVFDGQYCMVQRQFFDVDYDDIIMINTANKGEEEHIIIKRVIAKDGDTVLFMRTVDGFGVDLYICQKGKSHFSLITEPYIKEQMIPDNLNTEHRVFVNISVAPYDPQVLGTPIAELDKQTLNIARTVPSGEYFVLGDNRNVSKDSRDYGTFTFDQITAKVLFII